jgi:hypothetical protein
VADRTQSRALSIPGIIARLSLPRAADPAILLHASETWFDSARRGDFDFVEALADIARSRGVTAHLLRAERPLARLAARSHLNMLLGTPPYPGRWAFHIRPAYVPGFWYLDPEGVHRRSSVTRAAFDRSAPDPGADAFVARIAAPAPAGLSAAVAVFTQDIDDHRRDRPAIDTETMLAVTARASPGPVLVRLHPRQKPARAARIHALAATLPNVTVTDAPAASLIAAAGLIVTQNSATGFEALVHRKPVVTCAPCDFHHATRPVLIPDDLARAVAGDAIRALSGFPYAAYLRWFLAGHCLEPAAPDFALRLWSRITPALSALSDTRPHP